MNGNGRNSFYLGVLPWEEYFHHWSHWFYGESPRRKAAEIMSGNKECLHSHKTKERQRCQPETGGIACIKGKHQFFIKLLFETFGNYQTIFEDSSRLKF